MPTLLIYLACHSGIGEPFFLPKQCKVFMLLLQREIVSQLHSVAAACCGTQRQSWCFLIDLPTSCWIKSFKQNQSFLRWTASCSQTPFCGNTKQNDAFSRLFPKADLTVHMQLWHPVASTAWPQTRGLYSGAVLTVVYWTEKQRSWMASRHCLISAIFTQKCPVSHSWWNPFFLIVYFWRIVRRKIMMSCFLFCFQRFSWNIQTLHRASWQLDSKSN